MNDPEFPLELFFMPPYLDHIRESAEEARKVREWEAKIRLMAGRRYGGLAIEWARRELDKSRATPAPSILSDILAQAYAHLMRGDTITAHLEWRMK